MPSPLTMVAQKDTLRKAPHGTPTPNIRLVFLLLAGALLILFSLPKWKEVVRQNEDGEHEIQEWREDERMLELDRNDNAVQYRLVALVSKYYPCYLCKEGKVWVNAGETLKIGISTNPENRYGNTWIVENDIQFVIDVKGDLRTVRAAEINKIAQYPIWPENLNRPIDRRLIVPPFHRTIRLK